MYTIEYRTQMTGDKVHTITVNELDEWNSKIFNGGLFDVHVHIEMGSNVPLEVIIYPVKENENGEQETDYSTWEKGIIDKVTTEEPESVYHINDDEVVVIPQGDEPDLVKYKGFYYLREDVDDLHEYNDHVWQCSQCGKLCTDDDEEHEDGVCTSCHEEFEKSKTDCPHCEARVYKTDLVEVNGETRCHLCEND